MIREDALADHKTSDLGGVIWICAGSSFLKGLWEFSYLICALWTYKLMDKSYSYVPRGVLLGYCGNIGAAGVVAARHRSLVYLKRELCSHSVSKQACSRWVLGSAKVSLKDRICRCSKRVVT